MDVPQGHPQVTDPRTFLEIVEPKICEKLEKELRVLRGGLKFQLARKVELVKVNPEGSEEYFEPVLRHRQETVLQENEITAALEETFPRLQETRKIDPERIWVGGSTGSQSLVRYHSISTSPGRILHPTAARSEKQEGGGQREKHG